MYRKNKTPSSSEKPTAIFLKHTEKCNNVTFEVTSIEFIQIAK